MGLADLVEAEEDVSHPVLAAATHPFLFRLPSQLLTTTTRLRDRAGRA